MRSKYEELCEVAAQTEQVWAACRERCKQSTMALVSGLLSYCGVPNDRVKFLRWNEKDESYSEAGEKRNYFLPGAMSFDDEVGEWRVGICIVFTPKGTNPERWASFGLSVTERGGKVMASLGPNRSFSIDMNDSPKRNEFYDFIIKEIERAFTKPWEEGAEKIGFKTSRPAVDGEAQT
jgi:hypothetical protein